MEQLENGIFDDRSFWLGLRRLVSKLEQPDTEHEHKQRIVDAAQVLVLGKVKEEKRIQRDIASESVSVFRILMGTKLRGSNIQEKTHVLQIIKKYLELAIIGEIFTTGETTDHPTLLPHTQTTHLSQPCHLPSSFGGNHPSM